MARARGRQPPGAQRQDTTSENPPKLSTADHPNQEPHALKLQALNKKEPLISETLKTLPTNAKALNPLTPYIMLKNLNLLPCYLYPIPFYSESTCSLKAFPSAGPPRLGRALGGRGCRPRASYALEGI